MKLIYSPASPYVRKVMITAHELGLVDRLELVAESTTPLDPNPAVTGVNPVGKIPALVLAEVERQFTGLLGRGAPGRMDNDAR